MAGLGSLQLDAALAALASRSQPPAGGAASAFACAVAAALVELTAGLAARRVEAHDEGARVRAADRLVALAERAAELRALLLAAADDDVSAYAEVAEAPDRPAREAALARASEPPLVIAVLAAETAEAAAEVVRAGDWVFTADAVAAARLAAAAAGSGAGLVAADLATSPEDERIARAEAALDRAEAAARAATEPASGA